MQDYIIFVNLRNNQKHMKNKSVRFSNKSKRCNICSLVFEKLSEDHVPPKCCGNSGNMLMSSYYEEDVNINRRKGSTFITICSECNTFLGKNYDSVLGTFVNDVKMMMESHLYYPFIAFKFATNPLRLSKAILGHALATMVDKELLDIDFTREVQNLVLNVSNSDFSKVRIYYWCFPFRDLTIIKNNITSLNIHGYEVFGRNLYHIIKFYPVAFAIVYAEHPFECQFDELTKYINGDNKCNVNMTITALPFDYPEGLRWGNMNLRLDNSNDLIITKKVK